MTTKYPKESDSQEIGRIAAKIFDFKAPTSWICTELTGDTDFGVDYQVQLKDSKNLVKYSFKLQLKGTTQNKISSCGTFLSYQFDASTLNLYKNEESLVVIVLIDFSKHGTGERNKATAFYQFLDKEFFESIADKVEQNDKVSIRIPTANIFNENVEIEHYYETRIQRSQSFHKLGETICSHSSSGIDSVNEISKLINSKPNAIEAITNQTDAPWFENPKGTIVSELKEVDMALANGKVNIAKAKIEKLNSKQTEMTEVEQAEYMQLKGRILDREGEFEQAVSLYKESLDYSDAPRYLMQYIEGNFRLVPIPKKLIKSLSERLSDDDPAQCTLKAKCQIVYGNKDEGLQLLEKHHPDRLVSKMLLLLISDNTAALDTLINDYDESKLDDERSKFLFYSIRARRLTEQLIGKSLSNRQTSVPITGEASYNRSMMLEAKKYCDLSWQSAKSLGYPSDTITLLDMSMLLYSFCNQHNVLIEHLRNVLEEAPNNEPVIDCLSILLFNCARYKELNKLLKDKVTLGVNQSILLAMSCFYLKEYSKMLDIIRDNEDNIVASKSDLLTTLFCLAEGVAHELFELEDEARFTKHLSSYASSEHLRQIRGFIEKANKDSENVQTYALELLDYYLEHDKPLIIAFQLLPNLDCSDEDSAKKIIELGEDILLQRELSEEEYFQFCNALITLKDWDNIEFIANKQISLRYMNNQWFFLKAIAHHHKGEIGQSLQCLEELFKAECELSLDNVLFYTDICLKLGFLEKAETAIRRQISKTKVDADKKQLLRALIHIYTYNGPSNLPKFALIIKEFGQLIDQNNEQEESSFLMMFLFCKPDLFDETYQNSIRKRFNKFFVQFPNSNFLRKESCTENTPPESIIEKLNNLAGVDDEVVAKLEENKLSIRNGVLPVPLCYLHNLIRGTNDVFQSWVLSKTVDTSQLEYKISHAVQAEQKDFNVNCKQKKVLLEETSLLTLHELGLLSEFLLQLEEFYILQTVFDNLTSSAHAIGGSICSDVAQNLLCDLQSHAHKLNLIKVEEDILKTYFTHSKKEDVVLITDDNSLLNIAKADQKAIRHGNSINCLLFLLENGIMTKSQFISATIAMSKLGFVAINMHIGLLQEILYYEHNNSGVSFEQRPSLGLLKNILDVETNPSAIFVCSSIIDKYIDVLPTTILAKIVKIALDSAPELPHENVLIALYIYLSIKAPLICDESLFGASYAHIKLWRFFKEIIEILKLKYDEKAIFALLLSLLSRLSGESKRRCVIAVSGAFFSGSEEMNSLQRLLKE